MADRDLPPPRFIARPPPPREPMDRLRELGRFVRRARIWLALAMAVIAVAAIATLRRAKQATVSSVTVQLPEDGLAGYANRPSVIDYRRLDGRLGQLVTKDNMVGLAVGVVENGQLRFARGYGIIKAGGEDPVTADTVFRWASLSKGVAGTMVDLLASEKRLALTDPIARYSRSLKLPGGMERQVTVEDVLSHRMGIVRNAYDDKLEEGLDPQIIRRSLAKLDRYCAPGSCFAYQNVGFDSASEVVERVTKRNYDDAVRKLLFRPLGMTLASIGRAGLEQAKSWARPHVGRRTLQVVDAYYRVPAAGGVNSSIRDLARWMRAQMGGSPIVLPPALLEDIHRPRVATTDRGRTQYDQMLRHPRYALGWRNYDYDGHRVIGHRGAVDGYRSLILFDPVRKAGVVALWNSTSARPVGIQLEVLDMLYQRPRKDWLELDETGPRVLPDAGRGGSGKSTRRER